MALLLVLGGARSGKSRHAEAWIGKYAAHKPDSQWHYLATAQVFDDEMAQRIKLHQLSRDRRFFLHECPLALAAQLGSLSLELAADDVLLIDCITLWLSNQLLAQAQRLQLDINAASLNQCQAETLAQVLAQQRQELLSALAKVPAQVVVVSNEVGFSLVPLGWLSRVFSEQQGWLNQQLAAQATAVDLVVAGLPLRLKGADEVV